LTRTLWGKFPFFFFLADSYWGVRKPEDLHRCGIIPISYDLRQVLVEAVTGKQSVEGLYEYYHRRLQTSSKITSVTPNSSPATPSTSTSASPSSSATSSGATSTTVVSYQSTPTVKVGTPLISAISSRKTSFPVAVLGKGAWVALDLFLFGPDILMSRAGEQHGRYSPVNFLDATRTVEDKQGMPTILGHYEHRITMRKTLKVLQQGEMVPLLAFHKYGQHKRVFAFARCVEEDILIVALNMNNAESTFYLDFQPLARYLGDASVFEIVDRLGGDEKKHHYLTKMELINGKQFFSVPSYESLLLGVSPQGIAPSTPLRQQTQYLFVDSMSRLLNMLRAEEDASYNHIYQMAAKSLNSYTAFEETMTRILEDLPPSPTLSADIQYLFHHITKGDQQKEARLIAFLALLAKVKC
jgi:hypothetical protein